MKALLAFALLVAVSPLAARADDSGPRNSIGRIRMDAPRLLARRVRESGVDPKTVAITDVVANGDQALLSWDSGKQHGVMGLVFRDDRWWDALDMIRMNGACWDDTRAYPLVPPVPYGAPFSTGSLRPPPSAQTLEQEGFSPALVTLAAARNADVGAVPRRVCSSDGRQVRPDLSIRAGGGTIHPPLRGWTAGYDLAITYAHNDAGSGATFSSIFVRAPTRAEFLPYPTPAKDVGGPTDVGFFDVDIAGPKPVRFAQGTTVEMWFPFVLDDTLRYDISLYANHQSYGPYHGTIFDNVLHFELPAFTITPGSPLQAEISGWY